jgi:hypothetical protein
MRHVARNSPATPEQATRNDQNIFLKVGVFFSAEKRPSNSPRSPRNPPQLHHQKPPRCTAFSKNHP